MNPAIYYKTIRGYEAYRWSRWYWNPRKSHGKDDPPSRATPTFQFLILVFPTLFILSLYISQNYNIPENAVGFGVNGSALTAIGLFSSFVLGWTLPSLLALHSTRANDICYSLFQMGKKRRDLMWLSWLKKTILSTIVFSLCWITLLLSYGYVSETEIVIKSPFCLNEQVYVFKELEDVIIDYDEHGQIEHFYLVNDNGSYFDVYWYGYSFLLMNEDVEFTDYVMERLENCPLAHSRDVKYE